MNTDFYIVPAMREENIYFLFRGDYELKFRIAQGQIIRFEKWILHDNEIEFIEKNLIQYE